MYNPQESYTEIPSPACSTPSPAFSLLTPSPSPLHLSLSTETEQISRSPTPPRLPLFVVEKEEEPVSRWTRSQTRKKLTFREQETVL